VNLRKIYLLPITMFSVMAIIHNTYLAKETATLKTGFLWLDWAISAVFALGIESALWTLIYYQKDRAVKAYAGVLLLLNLIYYGRAGKLNAIISFIHPEAWLYVEGTLSAIIFSVLLSGFLWYLTEVAIADLRRGQTPLQTPVQAVSGPPATNPRPALAAVPEGVPTLGKFPSDHSDEECRYAHSLRTHPGAWCQAFVAHHNLPALATASDQNQVPAFPAAGEGDLTQAGVVMAPSRPLPAVLPAAARDQAGDQCPEQPETALRLPVTRPATPFSPQQTPAGKGAPALAIQCNGCTNWFTPTSPQHLFCSSLCRQRSHRRKQKAQPVAA
jgi:hypothetical protein